VLNSAFFVAGSVSAQNKSEVALNAKISSIMKKMTLEEKIGHATWQRAYFLRRAYPG
jgi:hypothetical protein